MVLKYFSVLIVLNLFFSPTKLRNSVSNIKRVTFLYFLFEYAVKCVHRGVFLLLSLSHMSTAEKTNVGFYIEYIDVIVILHPARSATLCNVRTK